ncbi:DcrB-related protein [Polyangium aurulentum]|uniref:DcrB-related protein n=1 Tax=Polyangium aurulentum TaxID=2567896 RepID=UPI0010AE7768|nr:DcrB-related protein [Polyangium aurulentum]UQA60491.1 DcrB-related protein [Polyangium aurulentum]
MRTFYMNEAALVLPDNAVDRTMTHVLLSTPSGARATFVVERLEIELGQTLREACLSYTRELQTRLRAFSTVFERESAIDGAPALEIGVRWRSDAGDLTYTRQAHLRLEAAWVILAIEGPLEVRDELDELFDPILASVQLRSE